MVSTIITKRTDLPLARSHTQFLSTDRVLALCRHSPPWYKDSRRLPDLEQPARVVVGREKSPATGRDRTGVQPMGTDGICLGGLEKDDGGAGS